MTELPADIVAAVIAYGDAMRNLASKNARSPQATVSRHIAKQARDDLDAVILRHLPPVRPKRSAEDEEALRMGGDR